MVKLRSWTNVAAPNATGPLSIASRESQNMVDNISKIGNIFQDYANRRTKLRTDEAVKDILISAPDEREDLLKQYDNDSWVDSNTIFDAVSKMEQKERLASQESRAAEKFTLEKEELDRQAMQRTALGQAYADDNQVSRSDIARLQKQYPDIDISPLLSQISKEEDQAMQRDKFNLDMSKARYSAANDRWTRGYNAALMEGKEQEFLSNNPRPELAVPGSSVGSAGGNVFTQAAQGGQKAPAVQSTPAQGVSTSAPENALQSPVEAPVRGNNMEAAMQQLQQIDQFSPNEAAAMAEPLMAEARRLDAHDAQIERGTMLYRNADKVIGNKSQAEQMKTAGMDLIEGNIAAKYEGVPTAIVAAAEGLNEQINTGQHIVTNPDGSKDFNPAMEAELAKVSEQVMSLNEDMDMALREAGVSYEDRVKMKTKMLKDLNYDEALGRYETVRDRAQKKIDELSDDKITAITDATKAEKAKLIPVKARKNFNKVMAEDLASANSVLGKAQTLFKNNPPPKSLLQNVMAEQGGIATGLVNDRFVFYGDADVAGDDAAPYVALAAIKEAQRINKSTAHKVGPIADWLKSLSGGGVENLRTAIQGEIETPAAADTEDDPESVQPKTVLTPLARKIDKATIDFVRNKGKALTTDEIIQNMQQTAQQKGEELTPYQQWLYEQQNRTYTR